MRLSAVGTTLKKDGSYTNTFPVKVETPINDQEVPLVIFPDQDGGKYYLALDFSHEVDIDSTTHEVNTRSIWDVCDSKVDIRWTIPTKKHLVVTPAAFGAIVTFADETGAANIDPDGEIIGACFLNPFTNDYDIRVPKGRFHFIEGLGRLHADVLDFILTAQKAK